MIKCHALVSQITPYNCVFVLVNYQTKLASTIDSKDVLPVIDTALLLAKTAKIFEIPTILTTIGGDTYGGPLLMPLRMVFPNKRPFNCDTLSVWEDRKVAAALKKTTRKTIVMAGLWTNFSLTLSTIHAVQAGYRVYVVSDGCGELSEEDDKIAAQRMVEAGAVLIDSSQILLQFQDYPRAESQKSASLEWESGGASPGC